MGKHTEETDPNEQVDFKDSIWAELNYIVFYVELSTTVENKIPFLKLYTEAAFSQPREAIKYANEQTSEYRKYIVKERESKKTIFKTNFRGAE